MIVALMTCLASAQTPEPAPDAEESADPWDRVGWGWAALPAVNYNSDEGFGFGAIGSLYRYDGETMPYRVGVTLNIFSTTKAIHSHWARVDWLEVGGLPLRLTVRPGLGATRTNNFCGYGWDVDCDPAVAEAAADALELTGDARDDFVRRYYLTRSVNPYLRFNARYALNPMPHRLELLAGYRLEGIFPGDFAVREPYEGSLYDQTIPGGESGWSSALQVGLMLDNRDNEPAPTSGYWIEGSVRGASRFWGSSYEYFGVNLTLRTYMPLGTERVVFANRFVMDGLAGETHIFDLASPGGFQQYSAYGSFQAGRGIRLRRYIGKVKSFDQAEVRATVWSPKIGSVVLDLTVLGFADVGVVSAEWSGVGEAFSHPLPGTGGGLRIAIDKNFVVRGDVGVSPLEDWAPAIYLDLGNTF